MNETSLIAIEEFCVSHEIETVFIAELERAGMVTCTRIDEKVYLTRDQLPNVEKYLRFYYELDINLEGIETVMHLLEKIHRMQGEMSALRNRLRFYENDPG